MTGVEIALLATSVALSTASAVSAAQQQKRANKVQSLQIQNQQAADAEAVVSRDRQRQDDMKRMLARARASAAAGGIDANSGSSTALALGLSRQATQGLTDDLEALGRRDFGNTTALTHIAHESSLLMPAAALTSAGAAANSLLRWRQIGSPGTSGSLPSTGYTAGIRSPDGRLVGGV